MDCWWIPIDGMDHPCTRREVTMRTHTTEWIGATRRGAIPDPIFDWSLKSCGNGFDTWVWKENNGNGWWLIASPVDFRTNEGRYNRSGVPADVAPRHRYQYRGVAFIVRREQIGEDWVYTWRGGSVSDGWCDEAAAREHWDAITNHSTLMFKMKTTLKSCS